MSNYPDGMTAAHWRHLDGSFPSGTEDLLGTLVEFPETDAAWKHGSLLWDRKQKAYAIGLEDTGDEEMVVAYRWDDRLSGHTATVAFDDLAEVGKAVEFEEWDDGPEEGFGVTITISNRHGDKATAEQSHVVQLPNNKEAEQCLASL